MAKIKMLITTQGSSDGIRVTSYIANREYDVSNALAKSFISSKVAVASKGMQRKAVEIAPENKVIEIAPDNKEGIPEEMTATGKKEKVLDPEEIRVFQLADELGTSSKEILAIAKKLKIVVTRPISGITRNETDQIRAYALKRK